MPGANEPPLSHHLVAPELREALEQFPNVDFSQGLEPYRVEFVAEMMPPLPPELEVVRREERFIPGPSGAPDVRILIYVPPDMPAGKRPALLNIHGGGYVIGAPEQNDAANRARALILGCPIVATSYRLAPKTAFPGAVEDCYAALCWMHDNAGDLGIDPARIAISGESAGGGHAAALTLHARAKGGPAICFQLLDSPMLDDRTGSAGEPHPYCGEFAWTAEHNRFGWRSLLGMEPGGADVPDAAVPARAADLSGLPAAFVIVGSLDLFLEEDIEYARRLARAGVPVELHVIPGGYHGFGLAAGSPQVEQKNELECRALARAMGLPPS
ncbi:MAG: alpha/beta hydrolase [Novosphingobium sp.]|nr:alpha/beta hydrolase [Novosphingobium sp.]MCP5402228.1 alpha/beta hydrolase [Novosphingobium sp.]